MGFVDPLWYLTMIPGGVVAMGAWWRTRAEFRAGAAQSANQSGADVARLVLDGVGATDVSVVSASDSPTNFYDPGARVLRLSEGIFTGRSLVAVGVAAHEAGHAAQQIHRQLGLKLRSLAVPAATLGSQVCWLLVAASLMLGMLEILFLAVFLFSVNVVIQLCNLAVERDASRFSLDVLKKSACLDARALPTIENVANAAALAGLGATLTGLSELFPKALRR